MARWLGLFGILLLGLSHAEVHGANRTILSIQELTSEADLILDGKVVRKVTQRDSSERIFTRIELAVTDCLKGTAPGDQYTLVHGGGILGTEEHLVSGQATFDLDERVVVFLVFNPRGEGVPLAMSQGKFHVYTQAESGIVWADNGVVSPLTPTEIASTPPSAHRLPLNELKAKIRKTAP